jgi:hypothetical protein
MKFTKFAVLIAGVLALVSFFLPYGVVRSGGIYIHVSAFDMVKGIDSVSQVSNLPADAELDKSLPTDSVNSEESKGYTMLIFGPPLLLLLIGGVAVMRRKLGRLGGVGALLLGLWAAVFGAALMAAVQKSGAEGASAGAGTYLFLAAGVLGTLAGLLTLIKPDRGELP